MGTVQLPGAYAPEGFDDPAGGGWGWYPVARIEDPESTDVKELRAEVLEIFGRMEQEHHATGRGPWPAARASNVARIEFRSNVQVTARATLTDLW
ncbi:MAG TPA: hypothetical protein VJB16_04940 [archaeon]|nr:hypothetical protein [archaeon]